MASAPQINIGIPQNSTRRSQLAWVAYWLIPMCCMGKRMGST